MTFHLESRMDDNYVVFVPVDDRGDAWWSFIADSFTEGLANVECLNSAAKSDEE